MIAIYMTVDNDTLDKLKKLQGEALVQRIAELEEDETIAKVDIGKLWDVMHFILTNTSATTPIPDNFLSEAIVGIEAFSEDEDADFVSYSPWGEIAEIVEALEKVDFVKLMKNQHLKNWRQARLFPKGIWDDKKEAVGKELIASFNELKELYGNALDHGNNVVVSIL